MQDDLEHEGNSDSTQSAAASGNETNVPTIQALFPEVRQNPAGSEPKQRDRDRQEREMIEENDREQPRKRKLQQQRGKAAQRNAGQQSVFAYPIGSRGRDLRQSFVGGGHERRQSTRRSFVVGRWPNAYQIACSDAGRI